MATMAKKMAKYKKGSKEYGAAMVKMKMLKWKLKHAKRVRVVKKVVKKGGKHAKKKAKKEEKKAHKLSKELVKSQQAMAALKSKMSKYKQGSKEAKAAAIKMKMLKWKLKH